MIDVAIHDDQFTDTVNRHTAPHHHRYIASTTKTHKIPGKHCITILSPDPNTTIIKLNLDSSENTSLLQLSSAFHSLIRVHQRTLFRRLSTPIKGFLLAILMCIFILFRRRFAVLGHVSTPMFSFHRAFIRPMDEKRCSSARRRRALSPLAVVFFRRPDLVFLLPLPVSWNHFQTRETVRRQIFILRSYPSRLHSSLPQSDDDTTLPVSKIRSATHAGCCLRFVIIGNVSVIHYI